MRYEDKAVAGISLHQVVDLLGDCGGGAYKSLAGADHDHQLPDRQGLGFGSLAPFFGRGDRVAMRAHTGPPFRHQLVSHLGVDVRQGAVGVVSRQVPVPQLFQKIDGGRAAHLLATDLVGMVICLCIGGTEDEGGGRQDQQLISATAIPGQPSFHVGIEGLTRFQIAMSAKYGISARSRELPALIGVSCLKNHRTALGAPGHIKPPDDVEKLVVVLEAAHVSRAKEPACRLVGCYLVSLPGAE